MPPAADQFAASPAAATARPFRIPELALTAAGLWAGFAATFAAPGPALMLAVLIVAAAVDAATHLIPNRLTYPAILAGGVTAIISGLGGDVTGFTDAAAGFLVVGGAGVALYAWFGLGGGDAKLFIAIGVAGGLATSGGVVINGLLIGAVFAIVNLAARGILAEGLQRAALAASEMLMTRRPSIGLHAGARMIPLGPALLGGAILLHWFDPIRLLWETTP